MVNLMLFNWNWGHGFTSCIFSHMFSTFSPYPLVIKHSYGSWIYGWFSWGSTMKNNDFDHVGGSWNRGTPKSSKSLEHFSIETSGDLGIPHDFGNLHIYICHIFSYSFPKFSPTCFPNFPHIISPYHLNGTIPRSCARWSKSSPGPCVPAASASGVTAIRWARRWRWRPLVVVPSWDDDVLYIYVCVYLCISLFTYLFIYIYVYMYIYRFNIYIYTYIYLSLFVVFYLHTYIYIGRKRCRHGCRDVDWNDFLLRICNMYICSTLLCVCVYIYIGERLEVPRNIEEPCDTIIHVWSSNIQKGGGVLASFELR